jgi:twinkle protein
MTIRPGELSVVTGTPGSGKSEFIDARAVNLAQRYGWCFAVCSFENPAEEHISFPSSRKNTSACPSGMVRTSE